MSLPKLRQIREWLPVAGGTVFVAWIGFLTLVMLLQPGDEFPFPSGEFASPEAQTSCVRMPDGFLICDDLPTHASAHP